MKRYATAAAVALLALALWRWHTKRPVSEAYRRAVASLGGDRWTFEI